MSLFLKWQYGHHNWPFWRITLGDTGYEQVCLKINPNSTKKALAQGCPTHSPDVAIWSGEWLILNIWNWGYLGRNNTQIKIFPFSICERVNIEWLRCKNINIGHKRCSLSYITKMWRMAVLIRHNCDQCKNNVTLYDSLANRAWRSIYLKENRERNRKWNFSWKEKHSFHKSIRSAVPELCTCNKLWISMDKWRAQIYRWVLYKKIK